MVEEDREVPGTGRAVDLVEAVEKILLLVLLELQIKETQVVVEIKLELIIHLAVVVAQEQLV